MTDTQLFRIAVPLAAAAALCPGTALAQRAPEPRWEIRADAVVRYDDNISRTSEAVATARGVTRSDYTFGPMLTVDIERPLGSHRVGVTGYLGYEFHAHNTELDNVRLGVNADADIRLRPCWVSPRLHISSNQSDLADVSNLADLSAARVKNTETVQTYGVDLACGGESGFRPVVGIEVETGRNSNSRQARAEYDSTLYSAGLRYVSQGFGVLTLYGKRRDTNHDQLPVPNFASDDYHTYEYGLSYERNLGTRIQLDASLGFTDVRSSSPFIEDRSDPTWSVALTALLGSRARLTVNTHSEFENSPSSEATVTKSQGYGANLDYAVNQAFRLDAHFSLDHKNYDYGLVRPGIYIEKEDRWNYGVGGSYDFSRKMRLALAFGREERRANGKQFDYNADFVTLSLGFKI